MNLKMRCHYCSECKQVESDNDSASGRIKAAHENGWRASQLLSKIIIYFCTETCELNHRRMTKTHLQVIGSVIRNA